ncbi:MAG: YkgJ family cysteine cluster protein [Symploca sp. SIO2C1]|nr:YkgJ family cysteine cluster protein [Symploca sp. SIO2C1]
MAIWRCVKQCGACCYLDPAERPGLEEYLSLEELQLYLNMVGEEGWCVNFDHATRECRIYQNRPRFCRVEPDVFQDMYGIEPEELNDFAIDCCREQIEEVYGDRSLEILRFNREVGI